jgi:hypothetical protein
MSRNTKPRVLVREHWTWKTRIWQWPNPGLTVKQFEQVAGEWQGARNVGPEDRWLTTGEADRYATRAGVHPSTIWGHWYEMAYVDAQIEQGHAAVDRFVARWVATHGGCGETMVARMRDRGEPAQACKDWLVTNLGVTPKKAGRVVNGVFR